MFNPVPPMNHSSRVRSDGELAVWRERMTRDSRRSFWPVRLGAAVRKLFVLKREDPAAFPVPPLPPAVEYQNKHA